jgi:hypothetical protein
MTRQMRVYFLIAMALPSMCGVPLFAQEPQTAAAPGSYYFIDASQFSFLPGKEIESYRSHGSGGCGPGGELGLGIADKSRQLSVSIVARLKSQRLVASVAVKPAQSDTRTQPQEHEFDLTDLRPKSLDIALDDDGRVYRLNLVPRLVEFPKVRQFRVRDLRLESWSFPESPVILNDTDYLGQLSMSHGAVAWCDIPGVARVEFSLLHLKDALPLGTLNNGVIEISRPDGTSLRISNVKNGVPRQMLEGGPYQVWVRWTAPTQTVEQYRASLAELVRSIRQRAEDGDLSLPSGSLQRLEKLNDSGRVMLMSNGLRAAKPDEIVD